MSISIVLPTYNEAKNLEIIVPAIQKEFPLSEIIVVDDSSPDGSAKVAEDLGAKVICRKKREGLGAALRDGYNNCANEIIVSMDADCSLAVTDIHRLLTKLNTHDLVVGSKYSKRSKAEGFSSRTQKILSYLGNKFFIFIFQLPVNDITLNFRAFRKITWEKLNLQENSNVFLFEMLIEAQAKDLKIAQIPIIFSHRAYGKSKTNLKKLFPCYFKFLIKKLFVIKK